MDPMVPCQACRRHLRLAESSCPFCGQAQRSAASPASLLGALVLAHVVGLSGCAGDDTKTDMADEVGSSSSDATSSTDSSSSTSATSSTSSTGTDSDDSVTTLTSNGLSFYAGADYDLPNWYCDPFEQDCPEGEKCVPFASSGDGWDSNKCVPVTGVGKAGDPCTWAGNVDATDDCDESSFCWNVTEVDGMEVGTCTPFCAGTADNPICDPGSQCLISNQGSVTLCIETCNPLLQDCDPGLGCFYISSEFFCVLLGGEIPSGEPCGSWNDCVAGDICVDAATLPACAGASCCADFCSLADPVCLAAGTECVAFFEPGRAPAGHEDVGVCLSPNP